MRTKFFQGGLALICGLLWAMPAQADDATRHEFQLLSNKRADLRSAILRKGQEGAYREWLERERPEAYRQLREKERTARDASRKPEKDLTLIRAKGHPKLVDFQSQMNKRADVRMRVQKEGMDAAFTYWLKHERPLVYQEYVKRAQQKERDQNARTNSAPPSASEQK